jgi:hypothetical protein
VVTGTEHNRELWLRIARCHSKEWYIATFASFAQYAGLEFALVRSLQEGLPHLGSVWVTLIEPYLLGIGWEGVCEGVRSRALLGQIFVALALV